jgi:hypothetical protein
MVDVARLDLSSQPSIVTLFLHQEKQRLPDDDDGDDDEAWGNG